MKGALTPYGFEYGPATIERACADDKNGWVMLILKTKKHPRGLQIYVTKTGKVRVHGCNRAGETREWKPQE